MWLARGANEGVNRSAHFIAIAAEWQGENPVVIEQSDKGVIKRATLYSVAVMCKIPAVSYSMSEQ